MTDAPRAPGAAVQQPDYTVRAVRDEEELKRWGEVCGRGFSHRPGDPARFYHRWFVDPTASLAATRVAVTSAGEYAGALRVFDRHMVVHGEEVRAAGIGEVCTDPAFRGKGVSTHILDDAIAFVESATPARITALHAAVTVKPLYERYGFRTMRIPYGKLRVHVRASGSASELSDASADDLAARIRAVDAATDLPALMALHDACNARLRIEGGYTRSEEYWRRWIMHSATGSLRVLTSADGARPVAYASIMKKPYGFQLCDYGAAASADLPTNTLIAFITQLVRTAAAAEEAAAATSSAPAEEVQLIVPTLLARAWAADLAHDVPGLEAEAPDVEDAGWMVRAHKSRDVEASEAVVTRLVDAAAEGRMLVWVLDSY